ncbi:Gfo/Idh/MocA family protein [Cohnella faecalis]|uniref:Gfo/Idh/MocA family oxidoreductase n=1 Tax=Cohnella faecalis TaxID=2315694 RepID=A0A398CDW3_9BACL|nr:Gfo/Idh/MocA family oxidoreductase [Cohnella faecalis]RIE00820.1 gfo/Idh/MocA family oxidoreductase [Cohnella faecalis]
MCNKLRLGIVGFGRIVELVHLPIIKSIEEIEVHGVFDITLERRVLAEKRGFSVYASLEEMLRSPIDAVLIATPPNSHFSLAVQALEAGKHLIVEKPVTVNAREATKLLQLARKVGKTVTVFQNRRYDGDFLLVKKVISEGMLGEILFVERRYDMFGTGDFFGVKSFHPSWRNEFHFGGGALMDWGVHLADQLLQLELGQIQELTSTSENLRWGKSEAEEYVHANMKLTNGILMSMCVNFGSAARANSWVVGGDKSTLQVVSDKEAYLYRKGAAPELIQVPDTKRHAGKEIYMSLVNHIQNLGDLAVPLEQAVETMTLLDAIRYSKLCNRRVEYGDFAVGTADGV